MKRYKLTFYVAGAKIEQCLEAEAMATVVAYVVAQAAQLHPASQWKLIQQNGSEWACGDQHGIIAEGW